MQMIDNRTELGRLELIVDRAQSAMIDGANALLRIRDAGLYKSTHNSFEAYCNDRFSITRSRAYQLIDLAKHAPQIAGDVGTAVENITERQVRALAPLDSEQRKTAWDGVEGSTGETPTGAALEREKKKTTAQLLNSSKSNEWYTPSNIIESARATMGSIDLDPASCELANKTVGAATYYDIAQNGLEQAWFGNVWCNPPYGRNEKTNESNQGLWTRTIIEKYDRGEFESAVFLVGANTGTKWFQKMWGVTLFFVKKRIAFIGEDGNAGDTSTAGTVIAYVGPDQKSFVREFREHGHIVLPHSAALSIGIEQ